MRSSLRYTTLHLEYVTDVVHEVLSLNLKQGDKLIVIILYSNKVIKYKATYKSHEYHIILHPYSTKIHINNVNLFLVNNKNDKNM